jgi:hypothetical protein
MEATTGRRAISYQEACEHAVTNWKQTNGMVCGGTYLVQLDEVLVSEVTLTIVNGMARPERGQQ